MVWKFRAPAEPLVLLGLPAGARILTVQLESRERSATGATEPVVNLWALVDFAAPVKDRWFELVTTSSELDELGGRSREYLGSFPGHGGDLDYHLFEIVSPPGDWLPTILPLDEAS
jgi:hypothetical protein